MRWVMRLIADHALAETDMIFNVGFRQDTPIYYFDLTNGATGIVSHSGIDVPVQLDRPFASPNSLYLQEFRSETEVLNASGT